MIINSLFRNKKIAVLGLGVSGMASVGALQASGARVFAWDDADERRRACAELGVEPVDLARLDWTAEKFDYLLLSPGIAHTHPRAHPVAQQAKKAGCPIICDVELLTLAQEKSYFIGITGTNGKSTTTALIGHIFEQAGREAQVGGNLGIPALALTPLEEGGVYVLELSSYQLELLHESVFDVAVLLNISPDHLDRHGGMEGYVAAKERIFETRGKRGLSAVVGADDETSREILSRLHACGRRRVIAITADASGNAGKAARNTGKIFARAGVYAGVYMDGYILMDAMDSVSGVPVLDIRECANLRGRHNAQNACAAYAVARLAGVAQDDAQAAIRSFPGLAHRQEHVRTLNGITFINDSKATNGEACARALDSYQNIYWIAGGLAKDDGLNGVLAHLKEVRCAFLIGDAADAFGKILKGVVPVRQSKTLRAAINDAFAAAREDGEGDAVVLLSPACASFDQFKNFMERGDAFREIAQGICHQTAP